MWQPFILELYANRLPPRPAETITFVMACPPRRCLQLQAEVRYHIVTERAYQHEYQVGLQGDHPYWYTLRRTLRFRTMAAEVIPLGA